MEGVRGTKSIVKPRGKGKQEEWMMGRGSVGRSKGNGRRSLEASDGLMVGETCAVCVHWKGRETHCMATVTFHPIPGHRKILKWLNWTNGVLRNILVISALRRLKLLKLPFLTPLL